MSDAWADGFFDQLNNKEVTEMTDIDSYMEWTRKTVKYDVDVEEHYLSYGLGAEVGEFQGDIAKFYRGDFDCIELQRRTKKELGDILWFVARLCDFYGWTVSEVLDDNKYKLEGRLYSGTIKGDGEDR